MTPEEIKAREEIMKGAEATWHRLGTKHRGKNKEAFLRAYLEGYLRAMQVITQASLSSAMNHAPGIPTGRVTPLHTEN